MNLIEKVYFNSVENIIYISIVFLSLFTFIYIIKLYNKDIHKEMEYPLVDYFEPDFSDIQKKYSLLSFYLLLATITALILNTI